MNGASIQIRTPIEHPLFSRQTFYTKKKTLNARSLFTVHTFIPPMFNKKLNEFYS